MSFTVAQLKTEIHDYKAWKFFFASLTSQNNKITKREVSCLVIETTVSVFIVSMITLAFLEQPESWKTTWKTFIDSSLLYVSQTKHSYQWATAAIKAHYHISETVRWTNIQKYWSSGRQLEVFLLAGCVEGEELETWKEKIYNFRMSAKTQKSDL